MTVHTIVSEDVWFYYEVSGRTWWLGVSMLCLSEMASIDLQLPSEDVNTQVKVSKQITPLQYTARMLSC